MSFSDYEVRFHQWDPNRMYMQREDQDAIFKAAVERISNGNPGAVFVLGLLGGKAKLKFDLLIAYYKIIELREWTGPALWCVYKDECGQDFEKFFARLMA